jgi:hypothetical protein
MRAAALVLLASLCASAPTDAQWLEQPTRGIPRTKDGKPKLTAKAPRVNGHPDLSGLWAADPGGYGFNVASDLGPGEVLPWADALYRERAANFSKDHPQIRCLPDIGPFTSYGMFKILQTRDVTAVLAESGVYRQIHTDGRSLPRDPQPTWLGYAIGRWEGDTFVVESAGFNDRTWLDFGGHPHSEDLRVTERFHRKDFGHLEVSITFTDPKAYTRPWTIAFTAGFVPDTELLEYVCNENEKDAAHMLVRDDEKATRPLSADVLNAYAGEYEVTMMSGETQGFTVTVAGDRLLMKPEGAAPFEAVALSETRFTAGGTVVDFFPKTSGTEFVLYTVEGDMRGVRKP